MSFFLFWGLAAAVTWGTADFCAKKAASAVGFWATVWGMNSVGALMMSLLWALGAIPLHAAQLPRLLLLGAGNTVGGVCFYYALEHGPLVLISPITAAYPVVSAVLAYFISGERLGPAVAVAVGGVIAGTLLASLGDPPAPIPPAADTPLAAGEAAAAHRARATLAAVAGAFIFGAVFFGLAAVAGANAVTAPVLVFRLTATALLAAPLLWGARLPPHAFRCGWIWATGVLDSAAYLLYAVGARHLPISVITSLAGLFSVWTLVLAVLFLRERLRPRQWFGVALILGAIATLALK